jgi:hypothetical protein
MGLSARSDPFKQERRSAMFKFEDNKCYRCCDHARQRHPAGFAGPCSEVVHRERRISLMATMRKEP